MEEGFTASGALRMGVSEMTRFGMTEKDFKALAALMGDLIKNGRTVKEEIMKFRQNFKDMQFCFKENEFTDVAASLLDSIK
jgi:aminomethyltransferase